MPGTRKLGKTTDQRMAMLRQQVTDFLDKGRMETTITRAKEIKPLAEKMITLGKKGDLAAYRQALSFITREDVANKLFKELAPSYAERNGGYTRIYKLVPRVGDAANMAIIELIEADDEGYKKAPAKKAAKKKTAKKAAAKKAPAKKGEESEAPAAEQPAAEVAESKE